jgi:dipeptidyl aminopeptidase/acylaminoacyl peptidase
MLPADLRYLRTPTSLSLSPDGRLVAVAVGRVDLDKNTYRGDIWVVPTDGSASPRRFTAGPRDGRPRFSPDGRLLAFVRAADDDAKPQLHVMPADGGEARQVCEHPLGVEAFAWSPDSTRIAYQARVPEPGRYGTDADVPPEKEPPRRVTLFNYHVDNLGYTFDRRPQLFTIDVTAEDAEPVQVTRGDFDNTEPAWSPDGKLLAFVSARHETRDDDVYNDVFVAPVAGGDAVRLTRTDTWVSRPAFSPDGSRVHYCAPEAEDGNMAGRTTGIWSVAADGSHAPQRHTDEERFDVESFAAHGPCLLLTEDDAVTTIGLDRGAVGLFRYPVAGGEPTRLVGGRRQLQDYDRAGGVLAAIVTTDQSAGEVAVFQGGGERVVTDFGALLARSASLRPYQELHATAPDGYPVHGWLVKPAGQGPFPVLLAIHGGPQAQYGYVLFDEAQVYAGAGYAVVLGNPRGSGGYGDAHGRAIVGDMGNLDAKDLLALLDAALTDQELDASRVGVMGGSYGGYMTSWLVGHTDRFVAAISERAVNAPDSFEGSSDIGWIFNDWYYGTDPERVRAQSPFAYVDTIRTPMLLIHSEHDWRCPIEQAKRLFVALKRRGVEVELLIFPGEGHELSRSGLPSHRLARFEAILDWWARHLKPSG